MSILVTRHGRTNYNDLHLCNADPTVDVHLTSEGIRQAKELKSSLGKYNIEKVYVSDLPRTLETSKYCMPCSDIPLIQDKRLSDVKTGFEGRPVREFVKYIEPDPFSRKAPGGESFQEVKDRVHSFLELLVPASDECILIITHMDPARIIAGYFRPLTDEEILNLNVPNCTLLEFE